MNILGIPVAVVSSLEEKNLPMTSNCSQIQADFDSIALVGHEAESDFRSLQQMDAKTTDSTRRIKIVWRRANFAKKKIAKVLTGLLFNFLALKVKY